MNFFHSVKMHKFQGKKITSKQLHLFKNFHVHKTLNKYAKTVIKNCDFQNELCLLFSSCRKMNSTTVVLVQNLLVIKTSLKI